MKKNSKNHIPLYDISISKKSKDEVLSTLQSGWLSAGEKTSKFEKLMSRLWNVKYSVAVNSASTGLVLALKANDIKKGDRVLTSPFTFVSTIEAIQAVGAIPVFVDILPENFTIDPSKIQNKITSTTKAIIPIDIAGHPSEYSKLKKICIDNSLKLISDSAHSIASRYKGKSIVHWCDTSVASLHATKNLFCGEGGIIFSKNKKTYDKIRLLSNHGIVRKYHEDKNRWEYDIFGSGIKGNISEVNAAIGIGQLSQFQPDQKKRINIMERYKKNLSKFKNHIILPSIDKNSVHGWHLFIIRLNTHNLLINRDKFIKLMAENNIECGVHYKPVFELSYYKRTLNLSNKSFPVTDKIWRQIITLPLYPKLKFNQVDRICHVIERILIKYSKL